MQPVRRILSANLQFHRGNASAKKTSGQNLTKPSHHSGNRVVGRANHSAKHASVGQNAYGLGQLAFGLDQRRTDTAQTTTGMASRVRARPTGPHAQSRAHERVSKPTGLSRTRAY